MVDFVESEMHLRHQVKVPSLRCQEIRSILLLLFLCLLILSTYIYLLRFSDAASWMLYDRGVSS